MEGECVDLKESAAWNAVLTEAVKDHQDDRTHIA